MYNDIGTYNVTLTASNACGSDQKIMYDYITVTEPPPETKTYAGSEILVLGTYSGDFMDTSTSNDVYEVITEALSTSHPRKVTSNTEHKWTFNLGSGGNNMMFYVEAYRPDNTDGDDFIFAYSTDDATYNNMVTVASTTEQVYSFAPPAGLTGTVYVRVVDSNRAWGNTSLDYVSIDEMYFSFESTPGPPVANFIGSPTSGTAPLTVQFTDQSTGDPALWSWDFGDGVGTSNQQNPQYTYDNAGTYMVTLTATNDYGSDIETKAGYITVITPGQTLHVSDITVTRKTAGPNCSGQCYVTIVDGSGEPLANATVSTFATGPVSGNYSAITSDNGVAFMETGKTRDCAGEWCFEVTGVTHASYTYESEDNAVTNACESGPM
jgi:PKD repeat protein